MRFYKEQHKYYCDIDLHARKMYVCILDQAGKTKVQKNINTDPEAFFDLIFPFLDDVAVAVECVFCWYWLADVGAEHKIPFVLGHALYMKAIHGGKTKNDKLLPKIEAYIDQCAKTHDPNALYRLRTMPGVGYILALSILYEIGDITRFKTVQDFCSYARLIRPAKESDGK